MWNKTLKTGLYNSFFFKQSFYHVDHLRDLFLHIKYDTIDYGVKEMLVFISYWLQSSSSSNDGEKCSDQACSH